MSLLRRLAITPRSWVAATSALLFLQAGCRKDPAPSEGASSGAATPAAPSTALRIAGALETPVLTGLPALAMLPSTTAAVGAIDGIVPMFTRLGYLEAVKAHPAVLHPVASFTRELLGVELVDLERFTEIGIDPHAPVGAAILRDGMFSIALFAKVTDAGKLATALGAAAKRLGGSLSSEIVGDATVHRIIGKRRVEEHYAWVVRGQVGMMIASVEGAASVARDAASRAPGASLASSDAMPKLLADLGRGSHGALWVNVESLVAASAPALRDMFGDNARERVESLMGSTLGDDPAIVLGGAVRASSFELAGRLAHAPGAPIAALLKQDAGRPAILHALVKPPLFVAGCRCDIQALYRAARKVIGGNEKQEVVASFAKTMLGLDVEKLNEVLSGELGFAVTGAVDLAALGRLSGREAEATLGAALGGAIVIGVTDSARMKALVEGILRLAPEPVRAAVKEVPGGWSIDVPEWKTVTARLGTDMLVVASDAETADSVLGRKPVKLTGVLPDAAAVLEASDSALVGAIDMRAFFGLLLKGESKYMVEPAQQPIPPNADKAQLTEYEAKQKAIEALRADEKVQTEAIETAVSGLMGFWAGRAVAGKAGIDGVLTVASAHPPREFFSSVFAMVAADRAKRDLWGRRWAAEDELRDLRSKLSVPRPVEGTVPFEAPTAPPLPLEPVAPAPPVAPIAPAPPVPPG